MDDEEGVFEIKDFSVATPWEAMSGAIEEAIRDWQRRGGSPRTSALCAIPHASSDSYQLSMYGDPCAPVDADDGALPRPMREMNDPEHDLGGVALSEEPLERVRRWFGLSAFVLLEPSDGKELDASAMALVQGALNVALVNCSCALPGFVLHEPWTNNLCGRSIGFAGPLRNSLACRFDVVKVESSLPEQLTETDGLVAFFRSKVWPTRGDPRGDGANEPVYVTCKRTYVLSTWPREAAAVQHLGDGPLQLAFGSAADPLPNLALGVVWPATRVADAAGAGEGAAASRLRPEDAPVWLLGTLPIELETEHGYLTAAAERLVAGWEGIEQLLREGPGVVGEHAAAGGRAWPRCSL